MYVIAGSPLIFFQKCLESKKIDKSASRKLKYEISVKDTAYHINKFEVSASDEDCAKKSIDKFNEKNSVAAIDAFDFQITVEGNYFPYTNIIFKRNNRTESEIKTMNLEISDPKE